MARSHDPELAPAQDDPAAPMRRAAGVASGCLMFVAGTLVKAAFIIFWFNVFSVIRLQAGF